MNLPGRALVTLLLSCVSLPGCSTAPPPSAVVPEDSTPSSDRVRLVGVLVHRVPTPGVKSVDAYLGDRFVLEGSGVETVLLPSNTVPASALEAVVGRRVRVEGTRTSGHPPQAGLAAPLGPDGQPMAQGAGVQVERLEPAATEP